MPRPDETLQESERKFREIFNKINDAIHLHEIGEGGRPGKFIDVNDVACRMLQYPRAEMLEHTPLDFATEYHSRPLEKIVEELNSVGHAVFETGYKRKDGTVVPVEVNAHVITLVGKKVVLSVVRDISERKKADENIRYAARQMSDIIENLPDATFVIDTKGVVVAWNRAIEAMTGIKKDEMIGKGNYEYALPFYGSRRPILIDLVFSTKEEIEKNYSSVKIDGSAIFAETFVPGTYQGKGAYLWGNASPLFDDQGNLYGAIESIRDISDRTRAEEALQESRAKYQSVLENFQDVYYRTDSGGRLILASPSWAKLLGYDSLDECIGYGIAEKFYSEPKKRKEFIRAVQEKGYVQNYDVVLKKKDCTTVTVATSSHLYHDSSGNVLGIEGTFRDITEYKRMEESLRESQTRLNSILQGSPIPKFVIDKNHRVIYWNKALEKFSGIRADEVIGTNQHWRAFYPKERPTMADLLVDNSIEKIPEYYEGKYAKSKIVDKAYEATDFFPHLGQSGSWLFFTTAPILDPKGSITGAVETLEDVTERKQAEEEIRTMSRFQESIISNANVWLMVLDKEGKVLIWNKAAEDISGYRSDEVVGRTTIWKQIYPDKEYRKKITANIVNIIQTNNFFENLETTIRCRDGQERVISWNTRGLMGSSGGASQYIAIGRDITSLKQAVETLRERERLYNSTLNDMLTFVAVLKPDGEVVFVNNTPLKIIGRSLDEVRGMKFYDVEWWTYSGAAQDLIREDVKRCASKEMIHREVQVSTLSGMIWIDFSIHPVIGEDGNVQYLIPEGRDVTERKKVEDALAESEARYRAVVEDQTEFICRFTPDGKLTFVNDAYCRYFSLDKTRCINNYHSVVLPPEDARKMRQHLASLTPQNPVTVIEHRIVMPSGEVRWQRWNDRAIFDKDGRVIEYQSVGRDNTQQKRAEESLRQSEEKFRNVLENVPDLVLVHRNGIILYVNPAMVQTMGYMPEEVINTPIIGYIVPEYHGRVADAVRKRATASIEPYEIELLTKDGGRRNVIVRGTMIEFAGAPASLNVLTDITERKQAEAALHETEERYRSLFDRSLDCVYIHDFEGNFIEANPSALKLLGYTGEEIRSVNFTSLLTEDQIPLALNVIQEVITTGTQKESSEYRVRRKDGNYVDIETTATLLYHEGKPYAIQGFAHDITERKKTEERLKKFNEELEKGIAERTARINASLEEKVVLLREVHHRVKNNLQIIISLVNLQMRQINDARLKQVMAETQNRVRAMSLVHEKLYQSESLSQIDLSDYIRFLATQLFAFYGVNSQRIIPNIDIRKIMVDINTAIPLGLIFNELMSNSLKYAFPEGRKGEIRITGLSGPDGLIFVIHDNGIGIPPDVDYKNTESLGLRLVNSLVDQLDGTIELEQKGGTTFTITIKNVAGDAS